MRLFECVCGARLFFDNDRCLRCDREVGFDPVAVEVIALEPARGGPEAAGLLQDARNGRTFRRCSNRGLSGCPWLVPGGREGDLCRACLLNRVIPPLEDPTAQRLWPRVEAAKRRWVYGLRSVRLPVQGKVEDPQRGMALDVKAPIGDEPVLTGHQDGVITIGLHEADPVRLEATKQSFREKYRTLLGHLRHESGHYYWMRLVDGSEHLPRYREIFGDERLDYGEALERHYASPNRDGWQESFVTHYASAHPWEDWAETWAHYLHMRDAVETAGAHGMVPRDASASPSLAGLLETWAALAVGINALNRSLGLPDPYPFPITPAIARKLAFVDEVVQAAGGLPASEAQP